MPHSKREHRRFHRSEKRDHRALHRRDAHDRGYFGGRAYERDSY
jgi:hypothetical protein